METDIRSVIAGYFASKDTLTEIRLVLAGAVMDRGSLEGLGFHSVCTYSGTEVFEMRPKLSRPASGEIHSLVRLWVSAGMHLRDIRVYTQTHECFRARQEQLTGNVGRLCRRLTEGVITPPAERAEDEWGLLTAGYSLKVDHAEHSDAMRQGLLLEGLIEHIFSNDSALVARAIVGVARFPQYCPDGNLLASIANAAARAGMLTEAAILINELLHREHLEHDVYNLLGCALHCMGRKECALQCFLWALEGDPSNADYSNNVWLEARELLPEALREGNFYALFTLVQRVIQKAFTGTREDKAEAVCALGLAYEAQEDFAEAERYYQQARDASEACKPALASLNRLNWKNMDTRRSAFQDLVRTFPELPEECGAEDRIPVKFTEGDTHGSHWAAVTDDVEEFSKECLPLFVSQGHLRYKDISIRSSMSPSDSAFAHVIEYADGNQIRGVCLIKEGDTDEDIRYLESFYPAGVSGPINQLRVKRLLEWPGCVEGQIDCETGSGRTLTFFDPHYVHDKHFLTHPSRCEFELCAFALKIGPAEERSFEISKGPMLDFERKRILEEDPNAEPEDIQSVSIHMGPEFSCLLQAGSYPDEGEFRAIARDVEWFRFRGMEMCRIRIRIGDADEEDDSIEMDLFAGRHVLGEYKPQCGDTVEGKLWLQGVLHSENLGERWNRGSDLPGWARLLSDVPATSFWRGILRASDFQMRALNVVCPNLMYNGQVTAIETVLDAIPCDPEIAISSKDGGHLYAHIYGYDSTEPGHESEVEAWKEMRSAYAEMYGTVLCRFVTVGFEPVEDGYYIRYAGLDELLEELGIPVSYPTFVREPG